MPKGIKHPAFNWDLNWEAVKNEIRDEIRDEAFEEAAQSVQRVIDVWKMWESDEGYEAINIALGIKERILGLKKIK